MSCRWSASLDTAMSDLPATPIPSIVPPTRRRRWVGIGIATCILLTAGGGGLGWYLRQSRPPQPPVMMIAEGADPAVVAAVEKARQQVLADPKSATNWGELGMVFAAHGLDPEAEPCFAEAERLDPADPRWPYFRGLAASVRDPDHAIPLLKRAITLKPNDPEALLAARLLLAEVLLDQHQTDAAEVLFREGVTQNPFNPRAQFGLSQVALTRGDRKAAREMLSPLAESPAVRKRAAILLTTLAREDGELTAAARYEEAARLLPDDPSWPDPYLLQVRSREVGRQGILREVQSLEAAGQLSRAAQLLIPRVQDDPDPWILVSAGTTMGKLRDYSRAKEFFRECLRRDPGHAQAHYFLAIMLFYEAETLRPDQQEKARGLLREAADSARSAVALRPDYGLAWLYLGRARLGLGETSGAVEALQQAVACRPEFVDPHLYLAEALAGGGRIEEAVCNARNAEKLARPGDTRPHQLLDRLGGKSPPPKG